MRYARLGLQYMNFGTIQSITPASAHRTPSVWNILASQITSSLLSWLDSTYLFIICIECFLCVRASSVHREYNNDQGRKDSLLLQSLRLVQKTQTSM